MFLPRLLPMAALISAGLLAARAGDLQGVCVSEFKGSATMGHKFSGAVTSAVFRVAFREEAGRTLAGFQVTSPMAELTTFHKKRDREMREHFNAEAHPNVVGTIKDLDWNALRKASGDQRAEIPFTLEFAGGKVDMTAQAHDYREESGGKVRFEVDFTVSQKACGCEPISMMAVMKVHDPVPVTGHVILEPVKP